MEKMEASDWSRAGGTSGDVTSGVLGWETADQWKKRDRGLMGTGSHVV